MTQLEQLKISGQLPSPRGIALAVLELSRRENATLGEIARVVQTDPALSGRLIKLSNAASSNIGRPVVSVQEAVVRQGMATVRQLALGFSLIDQYRDGGCKAFDYQTYWSHSLLMGVAMQAFSSYAHVATGDELFICGLLAQVGRLGLATIYPEEYTTVLSASRADPSKSLASHEHEQLETDHIELGMEMLADWGMPKVFIDPMACYEDPDHAGIPGDSRANSVLWMLRLAHRLADLGLAEDDARPQLAQEWIELAARLDLSPEVSGQFIDKAITSWREWGDLLKIPTMSLPPFIEISQGQRKASEDESPLRVVVANGNADTRNKIMALLAEDSAHVVYPADNGRTALALAMEVLPHVIIVHDRLPQLDGSELCEALRETEEGRRMHILLMTDEHSEEQLSRAYEAGADGFAPSTISAKGLRAQLFAAQRLVRLQNAWEKDRTQLRQIAAELAVANRRLANAALTDPLTGLPNRRSALEQLEQAWSATTRSELPLSVMVVDIDDFKRINDTFGHAAGDIVLREAAETLRSSARRGDSACRIGGEEFLVICPDTDINAAMKSAERLRTTLEGRRMAIGQQEQHITVSIGVATRRACTSDIDALVSAADQALYAAKQEGRNRCCSADKMANNPIQAMRKGDASCASSHQGVSR
ncbi:MAG: diguanylate cyclase [Pseudomonadales bacterium]|nr:diguanylate cyclase [Pseudomonadales bacterium]